MNDDLKGIITGITGKPIQDNFAKEKQTEISPEQEGEESVFGSTALPGSGADTGRMVEEVAGNEPTQGKDFNIADETIKDAEDLHGGMFSTEDVADSLLQADTPKEIEGIHNKPHFSETDTSPPDDKQ